MFLIRILIGFGFNQVSTLNNRSKNIPYWRRYKKTFFKGRHQVYLLIWVNFPSRIRNRIPNTDPDPGQPNQCGSTRIRVRQLTHNGEAGNALLVLWQHGPQLFQGAPVTAVQAEEQNRNRNITDLYLRSSYVNYGTLVSILALKIVQCSES